MKPVVGYVHNIFTYVEWKLNIPFEHQKVLHSHCVTEGIVPYLPLLVPAAVWLIIMLCLAGCPAGGL